VGKNPSNDKIYIFTGTPLHGRGDFYPLLGEVGKDVIEGEIWGKKIADIAFNFADF
jgi:hypothetical protein